MKRTGKRFGESICELGFGIDMMERNQACKQFLPHEVAIKLNMLGSFMEHRVPSNVDSSLAITFNWYGSDIGNVKLMKKATEPCQLCYKSSDAAVFSLS